MWQKWLKKLSAYLERLDSPSSTESRAFLWLWSLSFYLNYAESWNNTTITFSVLAVCISTFFIKNLQWAWALYLAFSTSVLLYKFPILANHSIYNLFVNFYLIYLLSRKRIENLSNNAIRSILVSLAVVYFWAAIHKVNSDYLYSSASCTSSFMDRINKTYFNEWLPIQIARNTLLPRATIALELFIAIFLLRKKTFFIGLVLATSFHMILAALEFIDFSMNSLSIFVLALGSIASTRKGSFKKILTWVPYYTVAQLAAGLISYFEGESGRGTWGYFFQTVFFVSFAIWVLFYGVKVSFEARDSRSYSSPYLSYFFPALVFIFASFNYLGLSTAGTFSMFSNVRTEGEQWNHLFIPKAMRLFSYQDKVYWVSKMPKSFPRANREHPRLNYGMPEIEFYRVLEFWRSEGLSPKYFQYELAGVTHNVENILEKDLFEGRTYNLLERKLLFFRRVQKEDQPKKCLW